MEHEDKFVTSAPPRSANGNAINGTSSLLRKQVPEERSKKGEASFLSEDEDEDEAWVGPVRYTKEYVDTTGAVTRRIMGDEDDIVTTNITPGVVEVVTKLHWGGNFGKTRPPGNTKQNHKFLDRLVGRKGVSRFLIHSPKLINALRSVVDYYPGQDLLGDVVEFYEPFCFLVHHWDKLAEYKTNHPRQHTADYRKECNEHIDILLGLLDKYVGPDIRREKQRHSQGVATFEYLWMLFRPGEKLFARERRLKNLTPCLMDRIRGGVVNRKEKPYRISAWFIEYNGIRFSRCDLRESIRPFDGEKEIMTLPIYPQSYHKDTEEEKNVPSRGGRTLQEQTILWGERYWNLRWPCLKEYSGNCLSPKKPKIEGRVMIDEQSFILCFNTPFLGSQDLRAEGVGVRVYDSDSESSDDDRDNDSNNDERPSSRKRAPSRMHETADMGNRGCECEQCKNSGVMPKGTRYRDYDDVDPNGEPPNRDHFFSLFGRGIGGFYLKERVFVLLDIDSIREPRFDSTLFDYLVVDDSIKSTIKSLALNNARRAKKKQEKSFAADFIPGKGEGQVFLLHGSPGVGKTCAAECVAELTERPLLSITSGDLGTKTTEMDQKLSIYFRLGELWNAVVVIDEADIYFEARDTNEIARNSLVSILLRALDYYRGMLFLTTNRMGVLDEAFVSRIHVSLFFKDLTDDDRKQVWKNNFKRLAASNIRITKDAQEYAISTEVMSRKWNGREIRNAFQTVVALAEADCEEQSDEIPKITRHHIKEVVRISKEFKDYLTALHKDLEYGQIAARNGLRALIDSEDKGMRGGMMSMRRRNGRQTSMVPEELQD